MEWVIKLNQALDYIERNLTAKIDYEEAARIACCSTYHFQRMFSYIASVPLSEYIRKRKMTLAAVELSHGKKVIDVALKYGYDSPTSFTRAFQSIHGITPTEAKGDGVILKAFPRISFQITIKGDIEMNYRIEKKESFRIIGPAQPLHTDIEENFKNIPSFWGKTAMDGTITKLTALMDSEPKGILGVSACYEKDNWKYYISAASTQPAEAGWEEYIVPAATWAIFAGQGAMPDAIQELEKRIMTDWLPTSGYEYASGPDIEVYQNPDPTQSQFEVWIPVTKKA